VLPTSFGLTSRDGLIAACLLLGSAWLALVRLRIPLWATAATSGAAAAAAVLVFPRIWPALAAPVLAALSGRRLAAVAAAAGTALAGLVLLAVFRHVPHIALGWHQSGKTTDSIREFSWSRRILEFLPLGGLVGLARRSAPAAAFFGTVLFVAVILPLSRPLDLNAYLTTIVPGLPAYWLLAASIPFLVPRLRPVTSRSGSTAATDP
jgi:hypothetical protein